MSGSASRSGYAADYQITARILLLYFILFVLSNVAGESDVKGRSPRQSIKTVRTVAVISSIFSARCNIYISRLCHDASPSVRVSVTEVHWRIIANLGFKSRSHFTAHWPPCCCGRRAAGGRCAACGRIISRHASQC